MPERPVSWVWLEAVGVKSRGRLQVADVFDTVGDVSRQSTDKTEHVNYKVKLTKKLYGISLMLLH